MAIPSASSQSGWTRTWSLLSIYALIAVCLPFASRLTSIQRLPIDSHAIAHWKQSLASTGCPVALPARLVVLPWTSAPNDDQWIQEVKHRTQALLDGASRAAADPTSSRDNGHGQWCVRWNVDLQSNTTFVPSSADFLFTSQGVSSQAEEALPLPVTLPPSPSEYSAESTALLFARLLAIELDLPNKEWLVHPQPAATSTLKAGQDILKPLPEGEPEPQQEHTIVPETPQAPSPLPPLGYPDEEKLLHLLRTLEYDGDAYTSGSDLSIDLPSHLHLNFHILNEAMSLDSSLPPITASSEFTELLRQQLAQTRRELQGTTVLGYSTTWGIGKETRGVKWDAIGWEGEREWEEEVEVEEEVVVEADAESLDEQDQSQPAPAESEDDSEARDEVDAAASQAGLTPRTEIVKALKTVTRSEKVPKKVTHLSPSQLEIFIDESGWDLTERGGSGPYSPLAVRFPYLYHDDDESTTTTGASDASHTDSLSTRMSVRTLHFLLYNPAPEHRPLIYTGVDDSDSGHSDDGEAEAERAARQGQAKVSAAVAQEADPKNWGWIVPSWGSVIIYNGGGRGRGGFSGENASAYTLSREELQEDLIPLFREQLESLLDMPYASADAASRQRHLFHLKRRTILQRTRDAIETLHAVQSSITKLQSLEVGPTVQRLVSASLDALAQTSAVASSATGLAAGQGEETQTLAELSAASLRASLAASAAFHNPRMLGMLYFPAEHHYAVYTPLFGPLAVPLILAGLKELRKAISERRRKKRTRAGERGERKAKSAS